MSQIDVDTHLLIYEYTSSDQLISAKYVMPASWFDIILTITFFFDKQIQASISGTDRLVGEFDSTSPTSRRERRGKRGMRIFPILGGGFIFF